VPGFQADRADTGTTAVLAAVAVVANPTQACRQVALWDSTHCHLSATRLTGEAAAQPAVILKGFVGCLSAEGVDRASKTGVLEVSC
jgi:hypothetical protein